tara:strand:+ start:23320 stop:24384 length:1065 start_codon:yes stop_codon:yes gene_type:complete
MSTLLKRLCLMSLFLLFLFSSHTRALTPHPCFYSAYELASDELLPCYGSTFSEHYSCCRNGDKCLEHGACFDADTDVTYQYGCTDSSFKDIHCPRKCSLDVAKSRWVGLVFCNGTKGLPADQWICNHPDNCKAGTGYNSRVWGNSIEKLPDTWCEDLQHEEPYVAIYTTGTLSDTAALPSPSRTSSWWSANADRLKTVAASRTGSLSSFATATGPAVSTSANDTSSSRTKNLALGLGVGVGVPVLLCIAGLTFFYLRRYGKKSAIPEATDQHQPDYPDEKSPTAAHGYKVELDSAPIVESFGSPPPPSEMEGSSVAGTPVVSPLTVHEKFEGAKRMSGMDEGTRKHGPMHEMAG